MYAATHDSTLPVGRIVAIDTAAAERAPGVLHVLTHLNADRPPYRNPAERPAVDPVAGEQLRVLQDDKVLFSGQPIALVIAKTQSHALYSASLIRVTYDAAPERLVHFDPARANAFLPEFLLRYNEHFAVQPLGLRICTDRSTLLEAG